MLTTSELYAPELEMRRHCERLPLLAVFIWELQPLLSGARASPCPAEPFPRQPCPLSTCPSTRTSSSRPPAIPAGSARVVVILVSGLRNDAVDAIPALRSLVRSRSFERDSVRLSLRSVLPSTSMPNWVAFGTGASASISGLYGDRREVETPFDSVFRQARLHGLSSFVTGSPWFAELYHSQLLRNDRFFAEGTVPPPYTAWGSPAAGAGA